MDGFFDRIKIDTVPICVLLFEDGGRRLFGRGIRAIQATQLAVWPRQSFVVPQRFWQESFSS